MIEEVGQQFRRRATARPERYRGRGLSVKKALRSFITDVLGPMSMGAEVSGIPARVKVDLRADEFAAACGALRDNGSVEATGTNRHDIKAGEHVLTDPSRRLAEDHREDPLTASLSLWGRG